MLRFQRQQYVVPTCESWAWSTTATTTQSRSIQATAKRMRASRKPKRRRKKKRIDCERHCHNCAQSSARCAHIEHYSRGGSTGSGRANSFFGTYYECNSRLRWRENVVTIEFLEHYSFLSGSSLDNLLYRAIQFLYQKLL